MCVCVQQCVNRELPDVQAGFSKGRGTRDQIANIHWIIEKSKANSGNSALLSVLSKRITEKKQKNIYFCFIDSAKAFDCMDHNKLWKIL